MSALLHAALFAVAHALVVPRPAPEAPAVVASRWEEPAELAPPPEVPPDEIPVPAPDAGDEEAIDEPAPMDEPWLPSTISVTDLRSDGIARTPRARARPRAAAPAPVAAPVAVAPPPPPVLAPPPPPARVAPMPRVATPCRLVSGAKPVYPDAARDSGVEGTVLLEIDVDASGAVADVRVLASSGSALLDRAAADAVRRWTFAPATEDGAPVPATLRLPPIRFRMER